MNAKDAKKELINTLYDCYVNGNPDAYTNLDNAWKTFEIQLCKEQVESCLNALERDAEEDNLGTLESILISVGNAPMPEL